MSIVDERSDPRTTYYEDCENELIHLSGNIQSYGVLVTINQVDGCILQVSSNSETILGCQPNMLISNNISSLIGEELTKHLLNTDLSPSEPHLFEPLRVSVRLNESHSNRCLMNAHKYDQVLILEFELSEDKPNELLGYYLESLNYFSRSNRIFCEDEFLQLSVNFLQEFTQFDRVMYYKFDTDGTGIVVNEARVNNKITSYFDHRFPASDIPIQARTLYKRNLLRFISNTETPPAALIPEKNPQTGQSLDLSYSYLRSVAPVHIQYLRNMKVQTSMSLPVIVDDKLIGLITCHSASAKMLTPWKRVVCQSLPVALNANLAKLRRISRESCESEARKFLKPFIQKMTRGNNFLETFRKYADRVLTLFDAHSLFLHLGDEQLIIPESAGFLHLPDHLKELLTESDTYISDHIADELDLNKEQEDLLTGAILIGLGDGDFLCIGRTEHIKTITWGGKPDNLKVQHEEGANILTPRASFESWKEEVEGHSKTFSNDDKISAQELRTILTQAKALEYRRLSEEILRQQATTDPLTGILNRREFFSLSNKEIEKAGRYTRPLSLIYFDIDYFKNINDEYGHEMGDLILVELTSIYVNRIRKSDIFARIGGEEFAILLPETEVHEAKRLAEELRQLIETTEFKSDDKVINVTCSFGICSMQVDKKDTLDKLLSHADKALYKAKEEGRNCVVMNNETISPISPK